MKFTALNHNSHHTLPLKAIHNWEPTMPISRTQDHSIEHSSQISTYTSYYHGHPVAVSHQDGILTLKPTPASKQQTWFWNPQTSTLIAGEEADYHELLPVLESLFGRTTSLHSISLTLSSSLQSFLLQSGIAHMSSTGHTVISRDIFWQLSDLWLTSPNSVLYPQRLIMNDSQRCHPVRPPKKTGTLYRRFIPWLEKTLSFKTLNIEKDLERFHRWMHHPRVNEFWQQADSQEELKEYLKKLNQDAHCQTLLGCFDDIPFAYFEVYWAKEDRIAPFYTADNYDRGWHLLVGEEDYRGRPWFSAWFPSLQHYLFLDDPRTQRIVSEPRHDNSRLIHHAQRLGFNILKTFDFPHKRAQLLMLSREDFFLNNRLHPLAK
ncbi:GNAT family N-acetyltransferase [Nitrosomonas sp.]|uniref:GNAT family N-acetyltransferase n=1 Tax=Nitrosomonas sp. TaxID=42353 RepID=UPI0037CA4E25